MPTIAADEIVLHPSSTGTDLDARLFEWRGELYRGVRPRFAGDYRALAESELYARLVEARLAVAAEPTDLTVDGFPLVVRHERVPFVSYPFEWAWPMLKDAGLALLDLNLELAAGGYLVKDPSSWNVLFDGAQPVYVDFTNIWSLERVDYARERELWPEWFRAYYTYPLRLVREGKGRVVRRLLRDYERGIAFHEYVELGVHVRDRIRKRTLAQTHRVRRKLGRHRPEWEYLLRGLRDELEALEVPVPVTKWSKYYDLSLSPAAPVEGLTAKHTNVEAVIAELRPETVCDIGPATGWFSRLAASLGARVVGLEADESAASRLYLGARDAQLDLLALVMDVTRPTAAYGLLGARVAAAPERFGADLTLALAVVHHLVHGMGLGLDQVAASLGVLSPRRLLVEWIDFEDEASFSVYSQPRSGYSVDVFVAELEAVGLKLARRLDSHPHTRSLLLCERVR